MSTTIANGSATLTVGAAATILATITTQGAHAILIDTSGMASGDTVKVTKRERISATGTWAVTESTLTGAQTPPRAESDSLDIVPQGGTLEYSIQQTAGTGRSFTWAVARA